MRLKFQGIHIDHDLPVSPAKRLWHRSSGYARDLIADLKLRQVLEVGLVQALTLQRDQADRLTRSVHAENHGRQRARG